jgi:hypothetical protein
MPYERIKETGHRRTNTLIAFLIFILVISAAFYALVRILGH